MITFDGDRSLKRKWFAEKQIGILRDLDLPAKALKWDGFTFRAWQQGDLDGGRVIAPEGAVVMCSTQEGIKIAVADHWRSAFTSNKDLRVLFKEGDGTFIKFVNVPEEEAMVEYITVPFKPALIESYFGLADGVSVTPGVTVTATDYSCCPVVMPVKGEVFSYTLLEWIEFDLDNNGVADWFRHVFEKTGSFYLDDGSKLIRKLCVNRSFQTPDYYIPLFAAQKVGTDKYVLYQGSHLYIFSGGDKVIGPRIDVAAQTTENILFADILNNDMPAALRSILITSANDGSCEPMGSYAFVHNEQEVFLHAVNATTWLYDFPETGAAVKAYYDANPAENKWRLFYSMTVGGVVHLVDSSQFLSLLDSLATVDCLSSWQNAKRMLEQIMDPYPNHDHNVPYDSVMFHAHDGNIHSWSRRYGAVRITTTGIFVEALYMPSTVEDIGITGVRPDISYAGVFDGVHLYLCISNRVKVSVDGVHYGSPFAGWTALPMPTEFTLVSVRPVSVTPEKVTLIGVVKFIKVIDEVPVQRYAFASLERTILPEEDGVWVRRGELPFEVGSADNFSLGLYGHGDLTEALSAYPLPPIVGQTPVGPYEKYAISRP